jgi:hypothetical protein
MMRAGLTSPAMMSCSRNFSRWIAAWIGDATAPRQGQRTTSLARTCGSGIRRLNLHRVLSALSLVADRLLRIGVKPAIRLRAPAHALHRRHQVLLLRRKNVPRIGRPAHVARRRRLPQ